MFTKDIKTKKETKKCPYCKGTDVVKKGFRKKKYEKVQLYFCNDCQKKFTPKIHKHKTFPLKVIIDSLTTYNRLNSMSNSAKIVSEKYGIKTSAQNISNWISEMEEYLTFLRMRPFINSKYTKKDAFVQTRMFHGQIYDFKYHRAKTDSIIDETFKHYKFKPLQQFLELVIAECPHSTFKDTTVRASKQKDIFDLKGVKIVNKTNLATKTAKFVTEAINNNRLRHEILQEFMLVNDSVTAATEIPVLLNYDDVYHYNHKLNFKVPIKLEESQCITGHIDLVQIRNGCIHVMDYKPSAHKEKPLEQLTVYALALARLTGIKLYHMKCAWFDRNNYYEFFPLHVVHKK